MDSDRLYAAALGEDIQKAVLLLKEDSSGKLESSWKFWADGDAVYAMNHLLNSAGEYQDVLYQLGTDENSTKEVWRSSEKQIPEQRDSLSSWYISGVKLYYYASGNDLWQIDLKSGEEQKLIALDGVLDNISDDGRVLNVSGGTAVMKDREGYRNVPKAWIQGWGQGLALAMLAALIRTC